MTPFPSRRGALTLLSAAGCGFGLLFCGPQAPFLSRAAAQTAAASPAQPASQSPERVAGVGTAQTDAQGRHLAPHDTFYLLSYVSVTTDTGVEGFPPGKEVHLVSVNRPAHTLVVTDGRAQVEVPPSKLTNDMDIAALVRQKDQANQARVASYVQAEEAAYAKHQQEEAAESAKNDERQQQLQQAQVAQVNADAQIQANQGSQPVDASANTNGYYGYGGYGYGSPYSYLFVGSGAVRNRGAGGPGGSRGTIPSDNTGNATRTEAGAAGGERGGAAAGGGGHAGGGGGKP